MTRRRRRKSANTTLLRNYRGVGNILCMSLLIPRAAPANLSMTKDHAIRRASRIASLLLPDHRAKKTAADFEEELVIKTSVRPPQCQFPPFLPAGHHSSPDPGDTGCCCRSSRQVEGMSYSSHPPPLPAFSPSPSLSLSRLSLQPSDQRLEQSVGLQM